MARSHNYHNGVEVDFVAFDFDANVDGKSLQLWTYISTYQNLPNF